jgi:Zn-dependent peptidase ImmA (M78 family)/transcriptional regulator with XRE-family HTH domain
MDLKILSANIRRIRNANGLSQKSLADASGISLPAIKNIESAKNEPRLHSLQAIARALKVNIQDLFLNIRILKTVRFRSRKQMQNRENILADIGRRLDDYNFLEETLNEKVSFKLRETGKRCSSKEIEKAACICRRNICLNENEPIRDICGLFEHAGIKMFSVKMASDGFFGLSVGDDDGGPAVVVNTWDRISVERQIFSAAHELGHLMLHKEAYDVNTVEENKMEEQQADLFAGYFLLPDEGFLKEWEEAAGLHPVDRVFKVKHIFHVSYKVVLMRLLTNGKVDKSIWQKFNLSYSKRYGRKLLYKEEPMRIESAEPFGLDKFVFYEDRFSKLVRQALEADKISLGRGAELLKKSISELQELIIQWKML